MFDIATARRMMVDGQIRTNDVTDIRLLAALLEVQRERFVPADKAAIAYLDRDVPIGAARRLLKPLVLAKLLQAAAIVPTDRVLDVGCATGYAAALLTSLAESVVALEEDAGLADAAKRNLAALAAGNATVVTGPLAAGCAAKGPYDVIVVEGAVEVVPDALIGQLADDGRLVCVVGAGPIGKATVYRRAAGTVTAQPVFDAAASLLPGFAKAAEFVF